MYIRTLVCATAGLTLAPLSSSLHAADFSVFIDDISTTFAAGQPIPDNLFDTSQNFANTTTGGQPTLAASWQQTVRIDRSNPVNTDYGSRDSIIGVTETNSSMLFYESANSGTVVAGDPILFSSFDVITGGGPMQLQMIDAEPGTPGVFDGFVNDLPGLTGLAPGTPIQVWQTGTVDIQINALTQGGLQPIAVNQMMGFQVFGDDGTNTLDNAFGIFLDDWVLPLGKDVLLSNDGTPTGDFEQSTYLEEWVPLIPIRWKGHPDGWVAIATGSEIPGPAGILHLPREIPTPMPLVLMSLALVPMVWRCRTAR